MTFNKAVGTVTYFHIEEVSGKNGYYTKRYPVIQFETKEHQVKFLGPSYMEETVHVDSKVPVIYDAIQPEEAYVNNFYGLWGDAFIFLLPFFIVWTICIFSGNLISKNIKLS